MALEESIKVQKSLDTILIVKKAPFFISTLVQEVTYDIRSANSTIKYFSPIADNKNGGRVSIFLSKLTAFCVLDILNNN